MCSWNRCLGRDSGGDAAYVGLGANLCWGWSICRGHRATRGSRQVALVWSGMEKELRGIPRVVPRAQPREVSTSTWGPGEAGERDRSLWGHESCPCARRSGWQTLPVLAAVTHRCRLALLPGASASMALLALQQQRPRTPPRPPPHAGLRVGMLVGECIYTLSPAQSNKFQIKQK